MDGLGAFQSFADPAAGANWSTTVPAGRRWRIWAGSALLVTTATAGNRNPFLTFTKGTVVTWAGGQDNKLLGASPLEFVPASATRRLVFYDFRQELRQTFSGTYLPIGSKAIWLEAGTVVALTVQNLAAGDQLSQVGLLIEDVAA